MSDEPSTEKPDRKKSKPYASASDAVQEKVQGSNKSGPSKSESSKSESSKSESSKSSSSKKVGGKRPSKKSAASKASLKKTEEISSDYNENAKPAPNSNVDLDTATLSVPVFQAVPEDVEPNVTAQAGSADTGISLPNSSEPISPQTGSAQPAVGEVETGQPSSPAVAPTPSSSNPVSGTTSKPSTRSSQDESVVFDTPEIIGGTPIADAIAAAKKQRYGYHYDFHGGPIQDFSQAPMTSGSNSHSTPTSRGKGKSLIYGMLALAVIIAIFGGLFIYNRATKVETPDPIVQAYVDAFNSADWDKFYELNCDREKSPDSKTRFLAATKKVEASLKGLKASFKPDDIITQETKGSFKVEYTSRSGDSSVDSDDIIPLIKEKGKWKPCEDLTYNLK